MDKYLLLIMLILASVCNASLPDKDSERFAKKVGSVYIKTDNE